MQEVLFPVLGISAIIVVASLSVIVVRFASAFARRLEARPPEVAPTDPAVGVLREELDAMQERLARDGLTAVASTPEEFAKEVARDTEKYGKVIRALGIQAQ